MGNRALIMVGALTVSTLLVAGCSGRSTAPGVATRGGPGGSGTGLTNGAPTTAAAALTLIPRTAWDTSYVEFGDVAQVVSVNGGPGAGPLLAYLGTGESSLSPDAEAVSPTLGFDPLKATSAVTLGTLPQQATILYGSFDAASVNTKLAAAGFKRDGTVDGAAVWAFGANGQLDPANPVGDPQLNVLQVFPDKIVYGLSTTQVEALTAPAATPLSSDGTLAALANCLGSAKAGLIAAAPNAASQSTPTIGIGLLADSARNASEELCVTAASPGAATATAAHWVAQIRTGRTARLNEPWSALLTNPQSTTLSGAPTVVRLTAQPAAGAKIGTLMQAYDTGDLSSLIGP